MSRDRSGARRPSAHATARLQADAWWQSFETSLDRGELDQAQALLSELDRAPRGLDSEKAMPGFLRGDRAYAQALLERERGGATAARPALERALSENPNHADAHLAMADVFAASGDRPAMIRALLATRQLDALADRRGDRLDPSALQLISEHAALVVDGLPAAFRSLLNHVPIVLERRPSVALVRQGFDPRSLGLFEGNPHAERHEVQVAPPRIVLFTANLLAAFPDPDELQAQVEITILHEVGHYFGLDEDQVAALGLA